MPHFEGMCKELFDYDHIRLFYARRGTIYAVGEFRKELILLLWGRHCEGLCGIENEM